MPRRALLFLVLVLSIAAVGYYFASRNGGQQAGPAQGPGPGGFAIPVQAVAVTTDALVQSIPAVGSLRSAESVVIGSEIAGRISKLSIEEGGRVAKGAVLVEVSPEIYQAELTQAEARLTLSRRNHDRALELQRQGAGTVRALDEAAAALRNDEAALQLARVRLDKTRITAPFDGVLGLRRVSVGAYVTPGDPIVNLEAIDPMKVDFRIPEIYLTSVHVGQQIDISVDALPGATFMGEVYAIDPQIDISGRSIVIRANVPNPEGRLRPGLFAHVNLIIDRRENALLVPERALVPIGEDQFVFKVVEGKAALTKIQIGQRQQGRVEVTSGLSPGDLVVTDGQIKLHDGVPVMVLDGRTGMAAQ